MRRFLFIISTLAASYCSGQSAHFDKYEQDTLHLPAIQLKRVIALNVGEAIIGIDYKLFMIYLNDYRKGARKQIRKRNRLKSQGMELDHIVAEQTKMYRRQLAALDSVYFLITTNKSDTALIDYRIVKDTGSPFGDFLPKLIEAGRCLVFDKSMNQQFFIIRQKGWKKNGAMNTSGSTLYFLNGNFPHFWARSDFSS